MNPVPVQNGTLGPWEKSFLRVIELDWTGLDWIASPVCGRRSQSSDVHWLLAEK